jgi:hypothetical protein
MEITTDRERQPPLERWRSMRKAAALVAFALVVAACTGSGDDGTATSTPVSSTAPPSRVDAAGARIPPAPEAPEGALAPAIVADLDLVLGDLGNSVDIEAVARLGEAGDARVAWLLADLLRFSQRGLLAETAVAAFERLTGTDVVSEGVWGQVTDWLIAWDLPAPPGYVGWKGLLFEFFEPGWAPFFDDEDADIDWRLLSWGGVLIDDRPLDAVHLSCPDGCIPALDDPAVTDAAGGSWYDDTAIVFGVVVNGEARAYPKNIMEVHEMVNDTIGGRRIGMPYCTLCGSAQAYLTDEVPDGFETLELRTSGLLSRSNKVMYEFHTQSVFDTFSGVALSGPLQDAEVTLGMISVRTSTWGDWKAAHPGTTIVAPDGGIGRTYLDDPLRGRDDDGPIFPIGDVDPRLPVQEPVLGVISPDGTAVAFPVEEAARLLTEGRAVEAAEVRVLTNGDGLRAETLDGEPIATHQAFWFAWSQFHPGTEVWTGVDLGG